MSALRFANSTPLQSAGMPLETQVDCAPRFFKHPRRYLSDRNLLMTPRFDSVFQRGVVGIFGLIGLFPAWGAPTFLGVDRLTNGDIVLRLSAPSGEYCKLETSTDLANWEGFATLRSTGTITHTDSRAPYLGQRFYRASQLSGTNIVTGDHIPTSAGDVVIHPIDHASFVMQWNGKMIYNDPVGATSLYAGLPLADLILVSHGHSDHFSNSTLAAVRGPTVAIVAPPTVRTSMTTALQMVTTGLANDASTTQIGINIEAVPAYNDIYHPRGTGTSGNGYILTIGNKRIYMSGDTGETAEMRALTNIDVAFLAMNVPFTMSITQATSVVRAFQPRVVYPYHYRNQAGTYLDFTALRQMVGTDQGIEIRRRIWYAPNNARPLGTSQKGRAHAHVH